MAIRLVGINCSGISLVLVGISIAAWILLLMNPGHIMTVEHCHISDSGISATSIRMLLAMNPIHSFLAGWGLMIVAMMLPKLILPVRNIYLQSLKRLRFITALLFVMGYMFAWIATGLLMIMIIFGLHLLMPGSYIPAIGVGIITTVWQFSPLKQQFLNRGHYHWILPAFGWQAYYNAFLYGLMHGVWCVGAGWALMLLPMLLPHGHNLAMLIVTFIMISEHMEHPQIPSWHLNFRYKLLRYIAAQIQIRFRLCLESEVDVSYK